MMHVERTSGEARQPDPRVNHNVGCCCGAIDKEEVERGQVIAKPGSITAAQEVHGVGVRAEQGRGRAAHAVASRYRPQF